MILQDALQETGIAEAYFDGYTVGVHDDEVEKSGVDGYRLFIQVAAMPPHFSTFCRDLNEVQKELDATFLPKNLDWTSVEPE